MSESEPESAPQSPPLVSRQPLSAVYKLLQFGVVAIQSPLWVAASILPISRPHPSWTFMQAVKSQAFYKLTDIEATLTGPRYIDFDTDNKTSLNIEPLPEDEYRGPMAPTADAKPATIRATWYPETPQNPTELKTVMLHFHGGSFTWGTGAPSYCGPMAAKLCQHVDAVLMIDYRLSGFRRTNPFPAAFQDTLTSYLYLVRTLGIPPERICLSGDSAGANLVIALTRYLTFVAPEIPKPGSVVLVSPYLDPLKALDPEPDYESNKNWNADYLPVSFLRQGALTYVDGVPDAKSNPFITPLGNPFATNVPIFVTSGTCEIFHEDAKRWCDQMRWAGSQVQLCAEENAPHDTLLCFRWLGREKEATETAEKIGAFIQKNLDTASN